MQLSGWFLYVVMAWGHPFHVSVCDIFYNPRAQRIELAQRIFLDDLEETLRSYGDDPYLDITHPKDSVRVDSLLKAYYTEKLSLWVDGKLQSLSYLGHERKENNMWSYLETQKKVRRPPKRIEIRNTLLFEQFRDQQNLIKIRIFEAEQTLLLHRAAPQQAASF